jgi:hypothetical protein
MCHGAQIFLLAKISISPSQPHKKRPSFHFFFFGQIFKYIDCLTIIRVMDKKLKGLYFSFPLLIRRAIEMKKLAVYLAVFLLLGSSTLVQVSASSWNIQTVASAFGGWVSFGLDANNNPRIGCGDNYLSWNGSGWSIQKIDLPADSDDFFRGSSLALDSNGTPHMSYFFASWISYGLKYATWNGSNWVTQIVDSDGDYPSVALDKAGNPHISYQDSENNLLKYAYWNGSDWNIQIVDSNDIADSSSIALDSNGNPHICYDGGSDGTLRHAYWNGTGWSIQDVDLVRAWSICLKIDSNDKLHMCYTVGGNQGLKYATLSESKWSIQTVDCDGWVASLALDKNGNPHIAYEDLGSFEVKYVKLTGLGWNTQSIENFSSTTSMSNGQISIALDNAGNPHIIYLGVGGLKYASAVLNPPPTTLWTCVVFAVLGVVVLLIALSLVIRFSHKK